MSKGGFVFIFLLLSLPEGHAQHRFPQASISLDSLPKLVEDSLKNHLQKVVPIEKPVLDSASLISKASQLMQRVEEQLLDREEIRELGELKNSTSFSSLPVMDMPIADYNKEDLAKKALAQGKEFAQTYKDQIGEATAGLQSLKQKYCTLPSSSEPETGTSRNSLKGKPFGKRLVLGGNLAITQVDPVGINAAPVIGWRFTRRIEIGVTGLYLSGSREEPTSLGLSGFGSYTFWKNFFGYLEHERVRVGSGEGMTSTWQQSNLAGLGSRLRVSRWLEVLFIACYNFSHENADYIYSNPLIVKTGFRFY